MSLDRPLIDEHAKQNPPRRNGAGAGGPDSSQSPQSQSGVVFRPLVFLEEFMIHTLFPFSVPVLWLTRGTVSLINHSFTAFNPAAIFFVWVLGALPLISTGLLADFAHTHSSQPDVVNSLTFVSTRQIVLVCNAVFLARNAVVAAKYALADETWLQLMRTLVVPTRVQAGYLVMNWMDPTIDVLLHELEVASARAGGPLLSDDKAFFVFDPLYQTHIRTLKAALMPNRRIRALIRRYAPSLAVRDGRVPVRLVALSVVLQAIERHRFNVLKTAFLLIGAQVAAGITSDIAFGHTADLFHSPFAPVLLTVWIISYSAYFVYAVYMLCYILLAVNDIRRRSYALKLLNRMVRPTLHVRSALRGLGVDSRLHSAIMRGNASSAGSSYTSSTASFQSGEGKEGRMESRPQPVPVPAAVASGMREGALFADWQDTGAAAAAEGHALTMALGPEEDVGEGMGQALLDDDSDGGAPVPGDADDKWELGHRTLSVAGLDRSLRPRPPSRGALLSAYGQGAAVEAGRGAGADLETAFAVAHPDRMEEEEEEEEEEDGSSDGSGRTGELTAEALIALQQSLRDPAPGDAATSQEVGASERPQLGAWERAVSHVGLASRAAAPAGGAGLASGHGAGSGYVAMEGEGDGDGESESEGGSGDRPRWLSGARDVRHRQVSVETANVPTVGLARPLLSLHVSQNVHAYLWCQQVVKNFGLQFKRRLEFDMSFAVILLLALVAWFVSNLLQLSGSGAELNQSVLVVTPILVAILGVAISLMVRDGIKINNMALVAKDSLMRQESMARTFWRELSSRRQGCVTRQVLTRDPDDVATTEKRCTQQTEEARIANSSFSGRQVPTGEAARCDLAVAWAARRVSDTAEVLATATTWVVLENEQNPICLFGIRVNNTLLRSLYTLALSSVSVGARYLVKLYQARE